MRIPGLIPGSPTGSQDVLRLSGLRRAEKKTNSQGHQIPYFPIASLRANTSDNTPVRKIFSAVI